MKKAIQAILGATFGLLLVAPALAAPGPAIALFTAHDRYASDGFPDIKGQEQISVFWCIKPFGWPANAAEQCAMQHCRAHFTAEQCKKDYVGSVSGKLIAHVGKRGDNNALFAKALGDKGGVDAESYLYGDKSAFRRNDQSVRVLYVENATMRLDLEQGYVHGTLIDFKTGKKKVLPDGYR